MARGDGRGVSERHSPCCSSSGATRVCIIPPERRGTAQQRQRVHVKCCGRLPRTTAASCCAEARSHSGACFFTWNTARGHPPPSCKINAGTTVPKGAHDGEHPRIAGAAACPPCPKHCSPVTEQKCHDLPLERPQWANATRDNRSRYNTEMLPVWIGECEGRATKVSKQQRKPGTRQACAGAWVRSAPTAEPSSALGFTHKEGQAVGLGADTQPRGSVLHPGP